MTFYKFTDLQQFRQAIRNVKSQAQFVGLGDDGEILMNRQAPMPTLRCIGSVKLHGTNAAIVKHEDSTVTTQSRNNIITPENDNAGFANFMVNVNVEALFALVGITDEELGKPIKIYGEWCGGNI